jgi:hypothetical protein
VKDGQAICAECGHVRSWHDRDAARAMTSGELASDRHCYREVGGAGCRCGGFRDSGEVALAVKRQATGNVYVSGVLLLLLIVLGIGLLYAYRSQTPPVAPVTYSQAIQEISGGQVKRITIAGSEATLELQTGEKQQLTLPDRPETFQKVVDDYNAANPSRRVAVGYQAETPVVSAIGPIILGLLPVLLIGASILYMFGKARSR